jgi:Met-zincin
VRWMMHAEPVFAAIGPSHVDPRTGEILDADIAFEGAMTRNIRGLRSQVLGGGTRASGVPEFNFLPLAAQPEMAGQDAADQHAFCRHGALAAEQLGYALDVMQAGADVEPDSPLAQQFVHDYVKDAIMHEVGHALGLRHNFRASRAYTEAQLADAEFTRANGTTGSVMEYAAVNLPRPGQSGGVPYQTAIGPYDYWAIEYAYKPMSTGITAEAERSELQRIAARGNEPQLAFGTDEDTFFGLDPETIQLDLGADPIAFASKRLDIARDLFKRQETRELSPQRDYAVLRRSLGFALSDVARALGVLARQLGGVRTLRDFPGSGRDPLQPLAANVQRESLQLMSGAVLAPEGLQITPALQRRLAPDYLDRAEMGGGPTDFAVPQRLLELQRAVLAYLTSDFLAARVLDSGAKVDKPTEAFQLSEIYQRVADDVWSELRGGDLSKTAIAPARRELQRDHVNRLALALLRPTPGARVDARGFVRTQARALLARLEATQARSTQAGRSIGHAETRAHLADSIDTLRQATNAVIQRQGL